MSIEAMKLALEALEKALDAIESWGSYASGYFQVKHNWEGDIENTKASITALRQAIEQAQKQEALDRKAENARELGLDYEPEQVRLECVKCGTVYADGIPPQTTQQTKPVAWMNGRGDVFKNPDDAERGQTLVPLYTQPQEPVIDKSAAIRIATALGWTPSRQPLTDEEIMNIAKVSCIGISPQEDTLNFAKVIEAVHGIKENT